MCYFPIDLWAYDLAERLTYSSYFLPLRYFEATLSANEGKIMNTVINSSFTNKVFMSELVSYALGDVSTTSIPTIPKAIDEPMNMRVEIFCIFLVYIMYSVSSLCG